MDKVDVGELKMLIKNQPRLAATLAFATRLILTPNDRLGDYATFVVAGTDKVTPEIVISKEELRRFAKEVLDKTT